MVSSYTPVLGKEDQEFKASQLKLYGESEETVTKKKKSKRKKKKEYFLKTCGWPVGMWGRSRRK